MLRSSNVVDNTDHSVTPIVVKLIENAGAMLEADCAAAKACLAQASALLQAAHDRPAIGATGRERTLAVRGGLAPWQVRRVTAYIAQNLDSTIRMKELSQITRLSRSYFTRAFKESFGVSPKAHLNRQRIARAQEMMLVTDEPISQIAVACGLFDQAHFSKLFRRIVGTTPNAWRRQLRAGPFEMSA